MKSIRSIVAFLALPGLVSGIVPFLLIEFDPWRFAGSPVGWGLAVLGVTGLLKCVWDFHVAGEGTLAHWDPPKHLVTAGMYRYTRNPMYLSVLALLFGLSVAEGSIVTSVYAAFVGIAFRYHVVRIEEPWLKKQFPSQWSSYWPG